MKKQDFLNDVMHEIDALKKYATKKEKAKLNFRFFNPLSSVSCIYGQITNNCASQRAKVLMGKCCIRVMDLNSGTSETKGKNFSDIKMSVNGSYKGQTWDNNSSYFTRSYKYLSVLEAYITLKGAKTNKIIQYIKGEINDLKL